MRPETRSSRLMYSSSSMLGQKLTSWMTLVAGADAVDAAEALDDAHRVPVDVVVDQVVAVLKVLALGDAVGGDQDVDLAGRGRVDHGAFLGERREGGQDRGEIPADLGQVSSGCCRYAGHHGAECRPSSSKAQSAMLVVEVVGGVGKGGEDDDLAIAGVDGRRASCSAISALSRPSLASRAGVDLAGLAQELDQQGLGPPPGPAASGPGPRPSAAP